VLDGLLFRVPLALGLLALLVVVSDVRYLLRRDLIRQGHERARDWTGLRNWLQRDRNTWRPFVRLSRTRAPGTADADLALQLHRLGLRDEAIARARKAVEAAGDHPRYAPLASQVHLLCAGALGLSDEADAAARRLESFPLRPQVASVLLLHDYQQGRLESARKRGEALLASDARDSSFTVGLAQTYVMLGELDRAMAVLHREPGDPLAGLQPKERANLSRSAGGQALLERLRSRQVAATGLLQRLATAQALNAFGRGAEALEAFSSIRIGSDTPFALEVIAARVEGRALAQCGRAQEARAALARHDALVDGQPFMKDRFERDLVAGQIELELGRPFDAEPPLRRAEEQACQPLQLHQARHALWKALQAQGKRGGAAKLALAVLADKIPSMLRKEIEAAPSSLS
jgi:tetratricopeptide (TPR) repeat protein